MADLTYLMNADAGANQFYTLARQYFVAAGSTVVDAPTNGQTLEGIVKDLNAKKTPQRTVNIVSHAFGAGAMEGATTLDLQRAGRTYTIADDLQNTLATNSLAPPGPGIITNKTRIVLYGCDVGRSLRFLRLLCSLFGGPGELLAPRRMSMFTLDGSTVKYRQAQSWTLLRKARLTPGGADAPSGGWPAYRTQFVKDASDKFGRAAIAAEIDGDTHLTTILTAAASNATRVIASTFFLEENIDILPVGTQTAKQAADSVAPISNGDPVTVVAQAAGQVDDTTVVTTISGADAYPSNAAGTQYSITLVLLGQVIDQDVPIAEGPGYARVTSSKGLAPSTGPQPTGGGAGSGGGSGSSATNDQLQSVIAELQANGASQEEIDALIAAAPQGDATEGLATASADGAPVIGDPDYPVPEVEQA